MSWRRNELITVTLPTAGAARRVCYVNSFVQPTANTKTCLPINNHGEYRKSPFNLFSPTSNRRKCLKKTKSLPRTPKGANFFPIRRIVKLAFFLHAANCRRGVCFSSRLRRIRHKDEKKKKSPTANRKAATKKKSCGEKVLSALNRVLR